jgi:TRAP-type C4-dicarboxylate transport system substrate-binding protein
MEANMRFSGKVLIGMLIMAAAAGSLFAAGSPEQSASRGGAQKVLVKFGNTNGMADTQTLSLQEVAKRLNESGLFQADVFPNSSLGSTGDLTEQAMRGAAIVTVSDPGRLASFVKDYGIIQMPYMLKDHTFLDKLLQAATYKKWESQFEALEIKLITSNWFSGARNFVCNKEINRPGDLNGLRIRTIGSPLFTESVNAMGAVATPMEWAEVYPAIAQKSLDGCEIQTVSAYASRIYEVARVFNKTGHFLLIGSVVTGTKFFNGLSPQAQQLFVKTFRDVGTEYQQKVEEFSEQYEKEMVSKYGAIIHTPDITPFVNAVQPVYEKLGYSTLRNDILKELGVK